MTAPRSLLARSLAVLALSTCLIAPTTMAWADDADPVVARANGVDIRQSDLTFAETESAATYPRCRRSKNANTSSPTWRT